MFHWLLGFGVCFVCFVLYVWVFKKLLLVGVLEVLFGLAGVFLVFCFLFWIWGFCSFWGFAIFVYLGFSGVFFALLTFIPQKYFNWSVLVTFDTRAGIAKVISYKFCEN